MSAMILKAYQLDDYRNYIPWELLTGIRSGQFLCIGGTFMDEPAGALVYEELSAGGVLIRSIYVDEAYRRLYVAGDMMEMIMDKKIFFTYEATGDRASLEPFFDAMDIDTMRFDCPMCYLPLRVVEERLNDVGVNKATENGSTFADLSVAHRKVAMRWMAEKCNERGEAYDWIHPDSVFLIEDDKVVSCVLLSDMEKGLVSVDLVYNESRDPRKLLGLFLHLILNIQVDYDRDIDVRMILTSKDGERLFGHILGEANYMVPVIAAA